MPHMILGVLLVSDETFASVIRLELIEKQRSRDAESDRPRHERSISTPTTGG